MNKPVIECGRRYHCDDAYICVVLYVTDRHPGPDFLKDAEHQYSLPNIVFRDREVVGPFALIAWEDAGVHNCEIVPFRMDAGLAWVETSRLSEVTEKHLIEGGFPPPNEPGKYYGGLPSNRPDLERHISEIDAQHSLRVKDLIAALSKLDEDLQVNVGSSVTSPGFRVKEFIVNDGFIGEGTKQVSITPYKIIDTLIRE